MKLVAAPARLSTLEADFEQNSQQRLHWSAEQDEAIEQRVRDILADVRARGDAAVLDYTARFDGLAGPSVAALELTQAEFKAAFDAMPAGPARGPAGCRRPRAPLPRGWQKKARARAGATATRKAPCWARRSRRWTASASTCPAARPRTPAAC
jgi:hypothetical protein